MRKPPIGSAALLLSTLALAAPAAADTWHRGQVDAVYPFANGDFIVMFDGEQSPDCKSANPTHHYYVQVGQADITPAGSSAMLQVAIAALSNSKNLSVYFDSSSPECWVSRMLISN